MDKLYFVIFIEVVAIIIIEIIIYFIIKLQFAYKSEQRIANYSIAPKEKYSVPWFDKVKIKLNRIVKFISKILNKSEVIKNYSKRYNKYIDYDEKVSKKPIDYISIKFIVGVILVLLYIISSAIQYSPDFMFGLFVFILGFFIPDVYLIIVKRQIIMCREQSTGSEE